MPAELREQDIAIEPERQTLASLGQTAFPKSFTVRALRQLEKRNNYRALFQDKVGWLWSKRM